MPLLSAVAIRRMLGTAAALALLAAALPTRAAADPSDPLWVFTPKPPSPGVIQHRIEEHDPEPVRPPPYGTIYGACGAGVDAAGNFYISDYYRHDVDVWEPNARYASGPGYLPPGEVGYLGQARSVDMQSGPCGTAFDSAGNLYVYGYHNNVSSYAAMPSFAPLAVFPQESEDAAHHLPTGVDVDPATDHVYVDHRTYIGVYETNGAPVMDGPIPLRIGVGSLQDGYGVAFSRNPDTYGRIYVADAGSRTVKIYDPAVDKSAPVAVIAGPGPGEGFTSLRDSALAIDRVSGELYVADDTQPCCTEGSEATIDVFDANRAYEGHLKFQVADAYPPGLAVDNSPSARYPSGTQGRVYVTSGNADLASIYGYPAGAATTAPPIPSPVHLLTKAVGRGTLDTGLGETCASSCDETIAAGSTIQLTAKASPGSELADWSGACSGTAPSCTVTLDESASVTAIFRSVSAPARESAPPSSAGADATIGKPSSTSAAAPARHRARHHRHHRRHRHRPRP